MPFVALIVGPYSTKGKNESLTKIFHLRKGTPYSLGFRQVPCRTLKKELLNEMKRLFMKYQNSSDKIDFSEKWNLMFSKEDKFIKCMRLILDKNTKAFEGFNI